MLSGLVATWTRAECRCCEPSIPDVPAEVIQDMADSKNRDHNNDSDVQQLSLLDRLNSDEQESVLHRKRRELAADALAAAFAGEKDSIIWDEDLGAGTANTFSSKPLFASIRSGRAHKMSTQQHTGASNLGLQFAWRHYV